jgi:large subunit ribosomal protein L24
MGKVRIKKDDTVVVITGESRSSTPRRVLQVYPSTNRVLVEGANIIKVHTKPNPQKNIKGGIVEREAPLHVSNVQLVDPETKKATRIGSQKNDDGRRLRIARRSGAAIDK